MNKYALITLLAIEKIQFSKLGPVQAWQESALEVYPLNQDAREKSCPKWVVLSCQPLETVNFIQSCNFHLEVTSPSEAAPLL